MWKDPIVEEVRKIRERHAAKFKYDLDAICRDLKNRSAKVDGGCFLCLRKSRHEELRPADADLLRLTGNLSELLYDFWEVTLGKPTGRRVSPKVRYEPRLPVVFRSNFMGRQ